MPTGVCFFVFFVLWGRCCRLRTRSCSRGGATDGADVVDLSAGVVAYVPADRVVQVGADFGRFSAGGRQVRCLDVCLYATYAALLRPALEGYVERDCVLCGGRVSFYVVSCVIVFDFADYDDELDGLYVYVD